MACQWSPPDTVHAWLSPPFLKSVELMAASMRLDFFQAGGLGVQGGRVLLTAAHSVLPSTDASFSNHIAPCTPLVPYCLQLSAQP